LMGVSVDQNSIPDSKVFCIQQQCPLGYKGFQIIDVTRYIVEFCRTEFH